MDESTKTVDEVKKNLDGEHDNNRRQLFLQASKSAVALTLSVLSSSAIGPLLGGQIKTSVNGTLRTTVDSIKLMDQGEASPRCFVPFDEERVH